ncbi:MAG: hypothetical protein WCR20_17175, partial [Verrucomicrobiota bacterium]
SAWRGVKPGASGRSLCWSATPQAIGMKADKDVSLNLCIQLMADGSDLPRIWIPVSIPTNAALFCFDFTLDGSPEEDMLTANIGGTNMFALEAKFMPKNATLNSGPIDVTPWAGKTVELFFGLIGGTSTNVSIVVNGMAVLQLARSFLAHGGRRKRHPGLVASRCTGIHPPIHPGVVRIQPMERRHQYPQLDRSPERGDKFHFHWQQILPSLKVNAQAV